MHWWIVSWLSAQGISWYDLGGASHEPGLRQFKKGLVGKQGKLLAMKGEYDHWSGSMGRFMTDTIFGLRSLQRRIRHGKSYGQEGKSHSAGSKDA